MTSTTAPRLLAGRYRIDRLVARGGMGEVWSGVDERLGRQVAVKLLRPELGADPQVRRRFEAEARAAAGLVHPNVVAVFDAGEHEGDAFLVMECLPGTSLRDVLAEGPLGPQAARSLAADVLGALAAAHSAGLVHRDVKPGNILLAPDGRWKVADFGIAKTLTAAADSEDLTATGLVVGTPSYLAPERIDGRAATAASDVYSTGVVLYEALTGRKPNGDPPTDMPADLAGAIVRATAPDPADRYPDASAMASALGLGLGVTVAAPAGEAAPPTEPIAAGAPTSVLDRRRRTRAGATAATAAVAVVVAVLMATHGPSSP
ncbi:MAG TPA: serine/threonine-protein kinase, partial [Acidimicrobiales bacterium]|nr:serine/threonine-protein kinase [Acidimicrobiales bacterium]